MRAAVITGPGGPEVLEIREVDPPTVGAGDVLVRVRATGLNRADILQRRGGYAPPPGAPAAIPGLEYAGEVVQVGAGAEAFRIGERVYGITGGGAHAELLAVPVSSVYEYARRYRDPLPSIHIGRHRRFLRADVEAWVRAMRAAV